MSTYAASEIKIITIPMNNQRIKTLNRLTGAFSMKITSKKKLFRVSRTHFLQQTQQPTTDLLIRIILAFWFVLINSIFVLAIPSVIRPFIDDKSTLTFNIGLVI